MVARSKDGWVYTPGKPMERGVPTVSVISPSTKGASVSKLYDTIVVGAGYAGLVSARNLASKGYHVLLLEGRDRVGGRTLTANIDGHPWELGGTWIHCTMPHVYNEVSRYGLIEQLRAPQRKPDNQASDKNYVSLGSKIGTMQVTWEEMADLNSVIPKYFNIDGANGRLAIPNPFRAHENQASFSKFDKLTIRDRLEQVRPSITDREASYLESYLNIFAGKDIMEVGFWDALKWWALCGYTSEGFDACGMTFKLECGQSGLARAIFDDTARNSNFHYSFETAVSAIKTNAVGGIAVTTTNNAVYRSKSVICTIPWNILSEIDFGKSALSNIKRENFADADVSYGAKISMEFEGSAWQFWTAIVAPGDTSKRIRPGLHLIAPSGVQDNGNSLMAAFAMRTSDGREMYPEEDPTKIEVSLKEIDPDIKLQKAIFTNWSEDKFAKGSWIMFRPGQSEERLKVLRAPIENKIFFANSDWAHGWRGWIDGAMEQGLHASSDVEKLLRRQEAFKANI